MEKPRTPPGPSHRGEFESISRWMLSTLSVSTKPALGRGGHFPQVPRLCARQAERGLIYTGGRLRLVEGGAVLEPYGEARTGTAHDDLGWRYIGRTITALALVMVTIGLVVVVASLSWWEVSSSAWGTFGYPLGNPL